MKTMNDLRSALDCARGHWPRIANDTGIDYFTIARIARGETAHPRIDTFEKLHAWLRENPPPYVSVSQQHVAQQQSRTQLS